MKVILEQDMTIDRLGELFSVWALPMQIREYAPASPETNLLAAADLRIRCPFDPRDDDRSFMQELPWDRELVVALDWQHQSGDITRRVLLSVQIVNEQEEGLVGEEEMNEWLLQDSQGQIWEYSGAICRNGPTRRLAYYVPYRNGVLDQTILTAAERLLDGAKRLRYSFAELVEEAKQD